MVKQKTILKKILSWYVHQALILTEEGKKQAEQAGKMTRIT